MKNEHARSEKPKVIVLLILLVILVAVIYFQLIPSTFTAPKSSVKYTNRSESQWIMQEIIANIVQTIYYAHNPKIVAEPVVSVLPDQADTSGSKSYTINIDMKNTSDTYQYKLEFISGADHIWTPGPYTGLAEKIVKKLNLPATVAITSPDNDNVFALKFLLSPSEKVLLQENQRISAKLKSETLNPAQQETAALLIGMMALREASGIYYDVRSQLNRMVSHLAIAQAFSPAGNETIIRKYVNVIISLLIDDQVSALQELESIESASKGLARSLVYQSYNNALRTRITGDWRILQNKQDLSLFEKMELFRAMAYSVSSDYAIEWLKDTQDRSMPVLELGRIAGEFTTSVGSGHMLVKGGTAIELKNMQHILQEKIQAKSKNEITAYLNNYKTRSVYTDKAGVPVIDILDDGMLAGYFQRHLMHKINSEYNFYKNRWGVKETADSFWEYVNKNFDKLDLFPIFQRIHSRDKDEYNRSIEGIVKTMDKHPEIINALGWHWIMYPKTPYGLPRQVPRPYEWFAPPFPIGTMYQAENRCPAISTLRAKEREIYISAASKAPYRYHLIEESLSHQSADIRTDKDVALAAFKPIEDYNSKAMVEISRLYKENKPEKYIQIFNKLCALRPGYYFDLGEYLLENNRISEAVEAYQKGVDLSNNSITMANSCSWLVNHYFDNGQKERAFEIARRAAKVYSHGGLRTMGGLCEKAGRLEEAEDYFNKAHLRYDNPELVAGFYNRHKDNADYHGKFKKMIKKYFPRGYKKAVLSEFNKKPANGVLIAGQNSSLSKSGLSRGDIIVAIDGMRIDNLEQYLLVRGLTADPELDLIVWQHDKYKQIHARAKNRQFGVEFVSFRAD